ncbi:hypothetical protein EDC96DRAFT_521064, partial [Choanephora cucurbitarum]
MSNQENKQDIDTMTHPSLYRDSVNCQVTPKIDGQGVNCANQKDNSTNQDWDLYPQMIRKVENEGNQKQVEHLHELENTSQ